MWTVKTMLCSILILLSVSLAGQQLYRIDTRYPVHDLMAELEYVIDTMDALEPYQVLKDSSLVFSIWRDDIPRLKIGAVYWGRISLETDEILPGWQLHFEDRLTGPPAWTKSNGRVDVYALVGEEMIFHQKTGVAYPENQRAVQDNWTLNRVSLDDLPPGQKIDLAIRIEGNSLGFPPYFHLTIRSPQQPFYHQPFSFDKSFNLFMLGCTFIIFLYHFLQYVYLRERLFLWFSVWVLFCCLTMAMSVGLIIGQVYNYRFSFWMIIANGVLYSFWFFGRIFINSKEKFPHLDKFILAISLAMIAEIFITAAYVALFKPQTYVTGVGIHYLLIMLYACCSIVVSVLLVLKKDHFAKYFGFGAIIFSLAVLMGGLWSSGIWQPPFDPYAWGIFLQIIIYSFGIAYRQRTLLIRSQEEKLLAQENYAEVQRLKDLDEVKTQFYTNLSHEFRTPLSLIAGPLEIARKSADNTEQVTISSKTFGIIARNTKRLQSLIDQLLELSRLESGKVHLKLVKGKLIQFIRSITYSFESMAESKGLSLNTSFPQELPNAYYDQDKLERILSNLLSNAFKYTSKGGAVTLTVEYTDSHYIIEISDTGNGIAKEEVKRIFERFYRVEGTETKGSGIGLALVKELVDRHNGQISVSSRMGQGTSFKVRMPYVLNLLPEHFIMEPDNWESDTSAPDPSSDRANNIKDDKHTKTLISSSQANDYQLPLVLLVEDNPDLRFHISNVLNGHYHLLMAEDGIKGERLAIEHVPDLIVSDVMMPQKDGYQLCNDLKTNSKTSHIPIIMLTAKAGQEHMIEGLTLGADAYLTKPFDAKELLVRIKNLIANRAKLWGHFNARELVVLRDVNVQSLEDQFLEDTLKVIRTNIDNELFSVGDLAKEVGFSRSQLNRKLKAICNKTPNQLIIEFRLNEAKRMLEDKAGTVSEIAYSVGYSNMSYFTKSFKEQFGLLPSKIG